MQKRKLRELNEYDIIRIIATLMVVIGHSAYFEMIGLQGSVNYTPAYEKLSVYAGSIDSIFKFASNYVYRFHMPLFFILSGSVFAVVSHRYEQNSLGQFIKNKFTRLLVPYFTYAMIFTLFVKFMGDFYNKDNIFSVVNSYLQGEKESAHLWFLLSSFWLNLIFFVMLKLCTKCKNRKNESFMLLLVSLVIVYIFSNIEITPFRFSTSLNYLGFFAMGFCFQSEIKVKLSELSAKSKLVLLTLGILAIIIDSKIYIFPAWTLAVIWWCVLYLFANLILLFNKISQSKLIFWLSSSCMTIYIMHDPLEYLILKLFMGNELLTSKFMWVIYYLSRSVGVILVSLIYFAAYNYVKKIILSKKALSKV